MTEIYFDLKSRKKGYTYDLSHRPVTEEGHEYSIGEHLGRGGNSVVFSCSDIATDEEYAIKFLLKSNSKAKKRFEREVALLKKFNALHITEYFGFGEVTARYEFKNKKDEIIVREIQIPFIVMELAEQNLAQLMKSKDHDIPEEEYLGQIRGLCTALAKMHEVAIHRDIKPENILITGGRWVLSDFGLCSYIDADEEEDDLTANEELVGPKFWLSPEAQNRRLGKGNDLTEKSDVFQIGALFWYVINGSFPTGVVTQDDWSGRDDLFPVIHKTLLYNQDTRTANGAELLREFEEVVDN